ncbi:MAG TPA: hypothetical protein PLI95_22275 [Polyangiaceae bacterium]|nr:hypothetical protein [Polyangiaceae bacterium]
MLPRWIASSALLLLTASTLPCCAIEDAVAVSASLDNPSLTVSQPPGGLVSNLSGSFSISMELGNRASDPSDVALVSFSLVRASDEADLLGKPLSFVSSPASPVRLSPGDSATVHVSIVSPSSEDKPLELSKELAAAVCSAGSVKIVGTLRDSAMAATVQLASPPFTPSGC